MRVCVKSAKVCYHESELGIQLYAIPLSGDGKIENNKKPTVFFVEAGCWGRIPSDKNPEKELQVIADCFNGYSMENGEKRHIEGWTNKIINIEQSNSPPTL